MVEREPLLKVSFWTALTAAVIAVAVAAGLDVPSHLQDAILGLVAVVAPVVVALFARGKVTPVDDPRIEGVGSYAPPQPDDWDDEA